MTIMENIDPRIMVRELKAAYPTNTKFAAFIENLDTSTLSQLYNDLMVRGGKLIQTVQEWNDIPEWMGWTVK
jgi:hypothetical protein